MPEFLVDIIIPIWNRPVETRSALASFVASSPFARLVMVNNGSERETERILDEFAEALDEGAILLATARNLGRGAAINLGISQVKAPYVFLADSSNRLQEGWFDPLLAYLQHNPQVGALTLHDSVAVPIEADHGSFDGMLVKSELFKLAGSFDESLDNGVWALRDFARRLIKCGFLTAAAPATGLKREILPEFGSTAKRHERQQAAAARYAERWDASRSYLIPCHDSHPGENLDAFRLALLTSARSGNLLTVSAGGKVARILKKEGFAALHENISFVPLPLLFKEAAFRKTAAKLLECDPATVLVAEEPPFALAMPLLGYSEFIAKIWKTR
ncbi:MAG: glycosyltransferase [Geobacter sp.]|nr:glycosyltransferase [Geobacter sp.]